MLDGAQGTVYIRLVVTLAEYWIRNSLLLLAFATFLAWSFVTKYINSVKGFMSKGKFCATSNGDCFSPALPPTTYSGIRTKGGALHVLHIWSLLFEPSVLESWLLLCLVVLEHRSFFKYLISIIPGSDA
ncbi:uncharacterized protein BT62DRAFT_935398 [Guyanagaster necrorhizus]|uniref:Uncharacterized protein n=1 Tax=Guyanagaster necrorhizus TaxID=856835 RepID=A0A9P8APL4_9AGAR|nr:uncharacterized protein BT62DRAFT_935398 [Guyanagaster necrorhizus MCA 3950]KAG7443075.1 hypothetical protein BT62DRAFT_935398 [Guyanagaster necrorhizus MCA 3950]